MGILFWLLVGGLVGWISSMLIRTGTQQDLLMHIAVGTVGALLGGWLSTQAAGADGQHGPMSIFVSLAGAIILLAIVALLKRRYWR